MPRRQRRLFERRELFDGRVLLPSARTWGRRCGMSERVHSGSGRADHSTLQHDGRVSRGSGLHCDGGVRIPRLLLKPSGWRFRSSADSARVHQAGRPHGGARPSTRAIRPGATDGAPKRHSGKDPSPTATGTRSSRTPACRGKRTAPRPSPGSPRPRGPRPTRGPPCRPTAPSDRSKPTARRPAVRQAELPRPAEGPEPAVAIRWEPVAEGSLRSMARLPERAPRRGPVAAVAEPVEPRCPKRRRSLRGAGTR